MTSAAVIATNIKEKESGRVLTFFLAILPVVMMYHFPGVHYGFATMLIAVGVLFSGLVILRRHNKVDWGLVFILSLYMGYAIYKSVGLNFILPLAIIIHIAAISTGVVNGSYLRKCIEAISVLAALSVIVQQIVHITSGFHVPLINVNWLTEELYYYEPLIKSGYGTEAMYRPSAFFLEPAHFTQYVIFGLGSVLFRPIPNTKRALLLSFGLFSTTSGMGFVLTFAIWGWWYLTYKRIGTSKGLITTTILIIVIGIAVLALLSNIPFFASIISRLTGTGGADYNAIDGRLFFWNSLFGDERTNSLLFGFGEQSVLDLVEENVYFTGFMKILYAYGIIGFAMYSIFLLYLLIHTNSIARMYVIIYIGLLFIANLTGFINIIFYIGITLVYSQINMKYRKAKVFI